MAYLLLQLFRRAEDLGLTDGDRIAFPYFQQHLADTQGMSLVHASTDIGKSRAFANRRCSGCSIATGWRTSSYDFSEQQPRPFL